mmetsp:Transcript_118991/g.341886  ORF Transcript_118991/g.341886 Transcript_118991/m.341886 type:complete len:541 (+) Transcript_118991:75-1697(+)
MVRHPGIVFGLACVCTGLGFRSISNVEVADRLFVLRAHSGLPDLEVLYTSYAEDACDFVTRWKSVSQLGLDMEQAHRQQGALAPSVPSLLQISAGDSVLIFDLAPWREAGSKSLPECLVSFLVSEGRTFFGMGLFKNAAILACEFDCVVQAVDMGIRAWPEVMLAEGGLIGMSEEYLGITLKPNDALAKSDWTSRPLSPTSLGYLAERSHLTWALANHFIKRYGPADKRWIRTEEELYRVGPKVLDPSAWAPHARSAFKVATVEDASVGSLVNFPAHDGLPPLEVLHTSDETEATEFMRAWERSETFGFDMKWDRVPDAHTTSRAALLLLSAARRVLIFDLVPSWKKAPGCFPASLASFLANDTRTFFGMGLDVNAAKLACIYDCLLVRGVDYNRRCWPELELGGGIVGLANKWLGTEVLQKKKAMRSNFHAGWLSRKQMEALAEHMYLVWALAEYFLENHGDVDRSWYMSESELRRYGMKLVDPRAWSPQAWRAFKALEEEGDQQVEEVKHQAQRRLQRHSSMRLGRAPSKRGLGGRGR